MTTHTLTKQKRAKRGTNVEIWNDYVAVIFCAELITSIIVYSQELDQCIAFQITKHASASSVVPFGKQWSNAINAVLKSEY